MVGGITQVCSAIAENTASTPPAAPSRWPVIDLVELTMVLYAWSPSAALPAIVSARSPAGVAVDRKSVGAGKGVSGRVELGGRGVLQKKTITNQTEYPTI